MSGEGKHSFPRTGENFTKRDSLWWMARRGGGMAWKARIWGGVSSCCCHCEMSLRDWEPKKKKKTLGGSVDLEHQKRKSCLWQIFFFFKWKNALMLHKPGCQIAVGAASYIAKWSFLGWYFQWNRITTCFCRAARRTLCEVSSGKLGMTR